ncbi:hypothetical protein L1887_32660 [Cichorium endivia]|nr:hypothetical protein L1887_32660 [Cichorium endivia]
MDASFPRGLWPPKLSSLVLGGLKKPISEWGPQNFPTSLHFLQLYGGSNDYVTDFSQLSDLLPLSLNNLHIYKFEKLESVAYGLKHLTSLQHLSIDECPKTMDLPESLLPSLLSLRIHRCPNLKEKSSKGGSYWPFISPIPRISISEKKFNMEIKVLLERYHSLI